MDENIDNSQPEGTQSQKSQLTAIADSGARESASRANRGC